MAGISHRAPTVQQRKVVCAIMIVYQCNSCNATVGGNAAGQTLPNLPGGWARVVVDMPNQGRGGWDDGPFELSYDLCDECSRLPMRFGLIEFNRD